MKTSLRIATLISGLVLSSQVFAAGTTLHFTGEIVGNVCNVTPTLNVMMGDITVNKLENEFRGERVPFQLTLTDCPPYLETIKLLFEGDTGGYNFHDGIFELDGSSSGEAGVAKGVNLEIRDEDGNRIFSNAGDRLELVKGRGLDTKTGINVFPFTANYISDGRGIVAGDANVSVQFSIFYN